MKNTLIMHSLLVNLGCATSAKAQKAYDVINYKAVLYGNQVMLQLADGYLLASKVTIRTKSGDQVFVPSVGEPDARGDLRFDPLRSTGRYKDNTGSWLMIKKLSGPEYSSQIKAVYWYGKIQKLVFFNRQK